MKTSDSNPERSEAVVPKEESSSVKREGPSGCGGLDHKKAGKKSKQKGSEKEVLNVEKQVVGDSISLNEKPCEAKQNGHKNGIRNSPPKEFQGGIPNSFKNGFQNGYHEGKKGDNDIHDVRNGKHVKEVDENGEETDDSGEDDWEAAADALNWDDEGTKPFTTSANVLEGSKSMGRLETNGKSKIEFGKRDWAASVKAYLPVQMQNNNVFQGNGRRVDFNTREGILRPEYQNSQHSSFSFKSKSVNGVHNKAWKADDSGRPLTLPPTRSLRLSSQGSCFYSENGNGLGARSVGGTHKQVPVSCPICTEELDTTDSSFVPCACGFRLCLFCHHRIAIEDGRCPGCRRPYSENVLKLSLANNPNVLLKN